MGIFSDNARKFYEHDLSILPCFNKAPVFDDWSEYCYKLPTEEEVDLWEKKYKTCDQIGLATGPASDIVAFDFDYAYDPQKSKIPEAEFKKDRKNMENYILALLPESVCVKKGEKGWTRFYKMTPGLKSISVNRNGIRLFDMLGPGRQTILPPSVHSRKLTYKWIGVPLDECIGELTELPFHIVEHIKELFGEKSNVDWNSRHGKLLRWILDIVRVEEDDNKIVEGLIAHDLRVNKEAPYLTDKHHHKGRDKKVVAKLWIERIRKFVGIKGAVEKPVDSIGWDYFFENSFPVARKDILSDKIYIRREFDGRWFTTGEVEGVLRTYAEKVGLSSSKVVDQLERWTFEKKKTDLLIDIPKWDGVDRISKFAKAIKSSEFSPEEIAEIIGDWGSKIFHRIYNGSQNRCIIFKGPQGVGKDTFVREMLRGFEPYYESVNLTGTEKDVFEMVSRLLVVHIEEFDQTAKLPIPFIKDLITKPRVFFREAYARAASTKPMMASWISTANVDDVLRDPTGNRRFILIPVDKIDWDYPKGESLQVFAQFKELHEHTMEFTSSATEAKIKKILDRYTPDSNQELIIESYLDAFRIRSKTWSGTDEPRYLYNEMKGLFTEIAREMGLSVKKVREVLKNAGYQKRFNHGRYYYGVPKT